MHGVSALPAWARRAAVATTCALVGCAAPEGDPSPVADGRASPAFVTPWRTVQGGFLAPPTPGTGQPLRPGTGAFVKLLAPTAVALRGNELLIVDSGAGRAYRSDIALNTLTPIAGAPSTAGTAVALGPDLSAWLLDRPAAQVLRFARDGRLLQTFRTPALAPAPVGFAVTNGGTSLVVADSGLGQLVEFRGVGAFATAVVPRLSASERRVASVSGVAATPDALYVLDSNEGVVHRTRRDGVVLESLGRGELKQPVAVAADRNGRVFVVDFQDRAIKVLQAGVPTQTLTAAQLGVQQISSIAIDERLLAVADNLAGQVVILTLRPGDRR